MSFCYYKSNNLFIFLQLQKQEKPIEMASSPNQALPPVTWRARRKIGKLTVLNNSLWP